MAMVMVMARRCLPLPLLHRTQCQHRGYRIDYPSWICRSCNGIAHLNAQGPREGADGRVARTRGRVPDAARPNQAADTRVVQLTRRGAADEGGSTASTRSRWSGTESRYATAIRTGARTAARRPRRAHHRARRPAIAAPASWRAGRGREARPLPPPHAARPRHVRETDLSGRADDLQEALTAGGDGERRVLHCQCVRDWYPRARGARGSRRRASSR